VRGSSKFATLPYVAAARGDTRQPRANHTGATPLDTHPISPGNFKPTDSRDNTTLAAYPKPTPQTPQTSSIINFEHHASISALSSRTPATIPTTQDPGSQIYHILHTMISIQNGLLTRGLTAKIVSRRLRLPHARRGMTKTALHNFPLGRPSRCMQYQTYQ
jgi:hypothetical protein